MSKQILGRMRILVVDDEEFVLKFLDMLLTREGHAVTLAKDGLKALELFKPGEFDLVITDLLMPRLDGADLAAKIKAIVPSQPILLVTGFADQLKGKEHPFDAILDKPFTLSELRKAIAEILV